MNTDFERLVVSEVKREIDKDQLKHKFEEQRLIFVQDQEKYSRKLDRSVEPSESETDIKVISTYSNFLNRELPIYFIDIYTKCDSSRY